MDNGGVSRGRSLAVRVSDRWKMTCDMWHVIVTCDLWHMTYDFFLTKNAKKVQEKSQKVPKMQPQKNAKKCPKVQNCVKKAGFHSIGATIRTRQESRCLPYTGFFSSVFCYTLLYETKKNREYIFLPGNIGLCIFLCWLVYLHLILHNSIKW